MLTWDLAQQLPATGQYTACMLFVCGCGHVCLYPASITYQRTTYKTHGWSACLLCGFANSVHPFSRSTYYLNLSVFNHNLYFHFASSSLLVRTDSKTSGPVEAHIKQSHKCLFWRMVHSWMQQKESSTFVALFS